MYAGTRLTKLLDREAMWVRFKSKKQFAIKIYVGSINAVSGEPAVENMATKLRRQKLKSQGELLQDYVVTPQQLWLDGIATAPGQVRPFVAVPTGSGYSVEAQITGEDAVAGLQFEITKRKRADKNVVYIGYPLNKRARIPVDLEMMTCTELCKRIESETSLSTGEYKVMRKRGIEYDRIQAWSGQHLDEVGIDDVSTTLFVSFLFIH
jgi:hypothetical protein